MRRLKLYNILNTKFKTLNSKQTQILKTQNSKLHNLKIFWNWDIWILDLFRISDLGFRVFSLGIAILFLGLLGCEKNEIIAQQKEVIPVRIEKVRLGTIKEMLSYVGDIKAKEEVLVYPKVSGKLAEKVKQEGSVVNKTDVIAYIDRDEVGFKFEKAPVESPISGIIGKVYVDIGANVAPGTALALVVDMDEVEIDLNIPEKYLARISLGQTAEVFVDAYPDEVFIGRVAKLVPVLDVATRTAPIELVIENKDHRLKSGMFAKVNLVLEEHQGVPVIIKEAILGKGAANYVYVIENNIACQREVKLGVREAATYEVLEGLKEGEAVAVMGQQQLYDGAAVAVEQ